MAKYEVFTQEDVNKILAEFARIMNEVIIPAIRKTVEFIEQNREDIWDLIDHFSRLAQADYVRNNPPPLYRYCAVIEGGKVKGMRWVSWDDLIGDTR